MKYTDIIKNHFREKPVFSLRDVMIILKEKGLSKNYAYLLVHNLIGRKEIFRITRGVYSFNEDLMVSGFAFSPFYYGLQESLSIRNFWEQGTNPVIITVKKVRTGLREVFGSNIFVRRIDRRMFFGFEMIKHHGLWIPVSDTEKTLIDFFYFNEPLQEKTVSEIKKKLDSQKLDEHLKKCSPSLKKKIGRILE